MKLDIEDDVDEDDVGDECDNCPYVKNSNQLDTDEMILLMPVIIVLK